MRTSPTKDGRRRCWWCGTDPLYVAYHDEEWGVPLHDDRRLFEMLCLEGFQAGLSWICVLRKRENFRKAFRKFDPEAMARFTARDIARLLRDPGIIRNRAKIAGAVANARAYLALKDEGRSFDEFLWQFTDHRTLRSRKRVTRATIPASSKESDAMAKELKRRGFAFVGTTVCYAHMQATGMVNDHENACFRFAELPA